MNFPRASGVLMHPSSLPGDHGIGDLGPYCYQFIDFLVNSAQSLWQIYPLGPTGFGDSPYQCFSSRAGNPLFVNFEFLIDQGLLTREELADSPPFAQDQVEYGQVIPWKEKIFRASFQHLKQNKEARRKLDEFFHKERGWLEDFALFMALKAKHEGKPWTQWPDPFKKREKKALEKYRESEGDEILFQSYKQFLFFTQWRDVRKYAAEKKIRIIGDVPIFVAHDSCDTWSSPRLFQLDKEGIPTAVAGVPPDYFSETGQLWGNPLFDWEKMAEEGYAWWLDRFQSAFGLFDIVRLDHFRGFEAYWRVPFGEKTAVHGSWVKGPDAKFFQVITEKLKNPPIIAEDLGEIDEQVEALRDRFKFPGMKILQFAFGDEGPDHPFLPHNWETPNWIAYTGTHDNDTLVGWYDKLGARDRDFVRQYLHVEEGDICRGMIRLGMQSIAHTFIVPMQDILELDNSARMNTPGSDRGNWSWRVNPAQITHEHIEMLRQYTLIYGRGPDKKEKKKKDEKAGGKKK